MKRTTAMEFLRRYTAVHELDRNTTPDEIMYPLGNRLMAARMAFLDEILVEIADEMARGPVRNEACVVIQKQ